jgi:hypothetical protein
MLMAGDTVIPATVTYTGMTATLIPTSRLAPNTVFTATVTTDAQNMAGIGLAADNTWTFTSVATSANGPAAVDLGTAGGYVILAKSGVSTTGVCQASRIENSPGGIMSNSHSG